MLHKEIQLIYEQEKKNDLKIVDLHHTYYIRNNTTCYMVNTTTKNDNLQDLLLVYTFVGKRFDMLIFDEL